MKKQSKKTSHRADLENVFAMNISDIGIIYRNM